MHRHDVAWNQQDNQQRADAADAAEARRRPASARPAVERGGASVPGVRPPFIHSPTRIVRTSVPRAAVRLIATSETPRVRRKLAGTRAAVESMAGSVSRRRRLKQGTYSKVLGSIGEYEKAERIVVRSGRLTPADHSKLFGMLSDLERLVAEWLRRHPPVAATEAHDRALDVDPPDLDVEGDHAPPDMDRNEAERRSHALVMLKPRIAEEKRELNRPDYMTRQGFTDETRTGGQDDRFGGGINRLDYVEHGEAKGVFAQERGWEITGTAGKELGIPDVDPNLGARSVAMSRLARLFGSGVIAETDFAVHTSATDTKSSKLAQPKTKLGVRQALAPGKEAAETPTVLSSRDRRSEDEISIADPTLQRALNVLQILDAIAGQLDRHWHNYYIATDGGRVTGVVGIDLDMSFAVKHVGLEPVPVDDHGVRITKANFVGMPALADKAFRTKVLSVPSAQVELVLRGLITDAELDATITRYRLVQQALRDIDRKKIVKHWGPRTARDQQDEATSYLGKMRAGIIKHQFLDPATASIKKVADEQQWTARDRATKFIIDRLTRSIDDNTLTPLQGVAAVDGFVRWARRDKRWRTIAHDARQLEDTSKARAAVPRAARDEYSARKQAKRGELDEARKAGGAADLISALEAEVARLEQRRVGKEVEVQALNEPAWLKKFWVDRDEIFGDVIDEQVAARKRQR